MFYRFFLILIFLIKFSAPSYAEKIIVFEFTEQEKKTLKVRKVKKNTTYTLGSNDNGNFLKAEAEGVGSGLGKEIKIDLNKTPFIRLKKIKKID